jgi:hypothetical protein
VAPGAPQAEGVKGVFDPPPLPSIFLLDPLPYDSDSGSWRSLADFTIVLSPLTP